MKSINIHKKMSSWFSSPGPLAQRATANVAQYREQRSHQFEKYVAFLIKSIDERIFTTALETGKTSDEFVIGEFHPEEKFEPTLDELDVILSKVKEHLLKEDLNVTLSGSKFSVSWPDPEDEKKNIEPKVEPQPVPVPPPVPPRPLGLTSAPKKPKRSRRAGASKKN